MPVDAIESLWLVTRDARVLRLDKGPLAEVEPAKFHLYREICPVQPMIASNMPPDEFVRFLTDPARPISVPRICFVDLRLEGLAADPRKGNAGNLPYGEIEHLRDCLVSLEGQPDKGTKTVDRMPPKAFPYRAIKSGFYVGDQGGIAYYPFPSEDELNDKYLDWWRSANV